MTPKLAAVATTIVGTALLITGIAMTVWRWTHATASFGWFAYAPLSNSTFVPGPSTAAIVSYVLTAGGAALAGLGAGVLLATRSAGPRDASANRSDASVDRPPGQIS